MGRGQKSAVGDTRVAPNGYHYTKTEEGWYLTHRRIAEERLGRKIDYDERVYFLDGDKTNLDPENIQVRKIKKMSASEKIREKREQIAQLEYEIKILEEQIRLEAEKKSRESEPA